MSQDILTLPKNIGRTIVKKGTLYACPLLGMDKFIKFCKARGISVDRGRLLRLERLGFFAPVYRVRTPPRAQRHLTLPYTADNDWFKRGWAWDTTPVPHSHDLPHFQDQTQEGYYSIFQIDYLDLILKTMTLSVHMDSYLETAETQKIDWDKVSKQNLGIFEGEAKSLREHEFRRSRALLCQFISNRYYFQTQSDQRTHQVSNKFYSDKWISVDALDWNWYEYSRLWKPRQVEQLFQLTPEKLRHAYEGLAAAQEYCDPIAHWYQLVQFVSIKEREKLKDSALRAETLRIGAHMLRLLYKDLYGDDLPHPNEVTGTVINHIPELEVRSDTRLYLELVVNRFAVNPRPKACLIIEGPSEEVAIHKIFKEWFGAHPGKYGIEIITLGGVDFATGGRADRFRAIFRLIDYLHHHQTFTFLLLDNENYAKRLKAEARKAKSNYPQRLYVTQPKHIKIWHHSFELDNFSATEITAALSALTRGKAHFKRKEVTTCIRGGSSAHKCLGSLYKGKTSRNLSKPELAGQLVDGMLAKGASRKVENRPIVNVLQRVIKLANRNPFPTNFGTWERNQASKLLAKKGK